MAPGGAPAPPPDAGPAPGPDRGRLLITDAQGATREHRLVAERTRIGRHADSDVVVQGDHAVSNRHAVIHASATDGLAAVEDANSTNGTTVNGRAVSRQPLYDGDRVGIGHHALVYRAPARPQQPPASAAPVVAGFVVTHGPGAGGRLVLDRALTRVGRPGAPMAAVTGRLDGHYIARVTGIDGATSRFTPPTLNGTPFGTVAVRLAPGDTVVIGELTLVFERPLRAEGVLAALA